MLPIARRDLLRGLGVTLGSLLGGRAIVRAASAEPVGVSPGFRFVHLTDVHVQPELRADEGMAACLRHVAELDPPPDFILTGGDLIMDALGQDANRARMLFELFTRVLHDNTNLPVYHCLGNHDVFGWQRKHGVTAETPQYGKKMFCDVFGYEKTYYTFDHKGWRLFVLDSVQPSEKQVYEGGLDPQQWEWLEEQLQAKPPQMPGVVVSHIPFVTVTVLPDATTENQFRISASALCTGAQKLASLLAQRNIRLVLSGHIHMVDEVDYRGVKYVCDGAVSGAWWKGIHKGFPEGYGVFDLGVDGSVKYEYVAYGWKAAQT